MVTAAGIDDDAVAAWGAATAALLDLIPFAGRCEYRVHVGETPVYVRPGLAADGSVETHGLVDDLAGVASLACGFEARG